MQREELYLQDIVEAVDLIEQFLHGIKKDEFLNSQLLQSAVLQKFIILGEASAKISDELKTRYPQTPWRQITGLRNIAAHAYFSVDFEVIWATAVNRLKSLREEVLLILQNEFPDLELRGENL